MMRLPALIVTFVLVATANFGSAHASYDITGIWSVPSAQNAKILIERQEDLVRIAVTDATELGQTSDWYFGEGAVDSDGPVSLDATSYKVVNVFGQRRTLAEIESIPAELAFDTAFSGTITLSGEAFAIERRPLVAGGLTAPIDLQAPEKGWYTRKNDAFSPVFVETQGDDTILFVLGFGSNSLPDPAMAVLEKADDDVWESSDDRLTTLSRNRIQLAGPLYSGRLNRARFQSPIQFTEDTTASVPGADVNENGIRDDIDALLSRARYDSSRVRSGSAEIARAFRYYLSDPSPDSAVIAADRLSVAYQCLSILAPEYSRADGLLIESLVFNTRKRIAAYSRYLLDSREASSGMPAVSPQNPNICSTFMQGVVRRFDTLDSAQLSEFSSLAGRLDQVESNRNSHLLDRPHSSYLPSEAAPNVRTCSATKMFHVSGVLTTKTDGEINSNGLKTTLSASGIDEGFEYNFISNPNPGYMNILDYIASELDISASKADSLIRSGFLYIRVGLKIIKVTRGNGGLVAGGIFITKGTMEAIYGKMFKNAARRDAKYISDVRSKASSFLDDDYRVIFVPHSYGNNVVNDAYPLLQNSKKKYASVASVANPTASVVTGGLGANRDDDRVLEWGARSLGFDLQPPTIFNAGKPYDFFLRHQFVESYLNNATARRVILRKIKKALADAKSPAGGIVLGTTSGGFTGTVADVKDFDIGRNGVTVAVAYEAYTIPDRFDVLRLGEIIATTGGLVSGSGILNATIPANPNNPTDGLIQIAVYGPDPGTAWNYEVRCPSDSN